VKTHFPLGFPVTSVYFLMGFMSARLRASCALKVSYYLLLSRTLMEELDFQTIAESLKNSTDFISDLLHNSHSFSA
jgi:hypothetical protein